MPHWKLCIQEGPPSQSCSRYHLPKEPLPQKGSFTPQEVLGRHQLSPPRVSVSTATSPAPARAVKPHFSCWDEQQDKVTQQKPSPAGP